MTITWHNETRRLGDLIPWDRNPRQMTKKQAADLRLSLRKFGYVEPIAINTDDTIIGGHQRKRLMEMIEAFGPEIEVDVRVPERALDEGEVAELNIRLNRNLGEWDFDSLCNFDADDLMDWGFDEGELGLHGFDFDKGELAHTIGREGRKYTERDTDPYKLAYRVEAAWRARGGKALDLFTGQGQLAAWYRRRFENVITVDKSDECDADFTMTARKFISEHLGQHLDFDFVDLDDEGCPGREIQAFFETIRDVKQGPFVFALTDGGGLNLKLQGKYDPAIYGLSGAVRQATSADYAQFEETVTSFVRRVSSSAGFNSEALSSCRGSEGNVVYQTWMMLPSNAEPHAADYDSQEEDTVAGLS